MGKSFDSAKGSWITQELRRITRTKIEEIISKQNSTCFIDENGSAYIEALTIRITTDT